MAQQNYEIPALPLHEDMETPAILRQLTLASRALGELKGEAKTIPNQTILINTLFLQEAKASSEIENIVTTQDELFQVEDIVRGSPAAKEVARYRDALMIGYRRLNETKGSLKNNLLIEMFKCLKQIDDGFRRAPGTVIRNKATGEDIHVPPQSYEDIADHMKKLEAFINQDEDCPLDPLIKMAIIHHQFESIHPFSDGNGRIGRILNILYLTRTGLLDSPILYLSREINRTKSDYYRSLQAVRDDGAWEAWIIYMLDAVYRSARDATRLINDIRILMADFKKRIRSDLPRVYSQDLVNNLFRHPYTRIEYVVADLGVSKGTATSYLRSLTNRGFVSKHKKGRNNYYINDALMALLLDVSSDD